MESNGDDRSQAEALGDRLNVDWVFLGRSLLKGTAYKNGEPQAEGSAGITYLAVDEKAPHAICLQLVNKCYCEVFDGNGDLVDEQFVDI